MERQVLYSRARLSGRKGFGFLDPDAAAVPHNERIRIFAVTVTVAVRWKLMKRRTSAFMS